MKATLLLLYLLLNHFCLAGSESASRKVCLNMIVKNESKVIQTCLSSVKKYIDYWVIVDTGSTDGTQQMIQEFMKDIPGELYERPWHNFSHNRNEALILAKKKAEYILFIDADEQFVAPQDFTTSQLDKDYYFTTIRCEYTDTLRPLMIKESLDWKWEGVVHEKLICYEAKTCAVLPGVYNLAISKEGARGQDPQKFYKDAAVLEKALENDPQNSRYVFYLAQSYFNASEFERALVNYTKRARMGEDGKGQEGVEEVFFSLYMVARMQELLGKEERIVMQSYLKAYQFRPQRIEPLCRLSHFLSSQGNYILAYLLLKDVLEIAYPKDSMFVEFWIYDYGLRFAFANAALGLGKYEEARNHYTQLLQLNSLTQVDRADIQKNLSVAHAHCCAANAMKKRLKSKRTSL